MSNCAWKQTYTKGYAESIARTLRRRGPPHDTLDAYYCHIHHGWHVGHRPYWVEERRQLASFHEADESPTGIEVIPAEFPLPNRSGLMTIGEYLQWKDQNR